MPTTAALEEARAAYDRQEWARAFELYDAIRPTGADDEDRYAISAMLLGRMEDYFSVRERSYELRLAEHDLAGAALAAFWSGMQRVVAGDVATGSGWLARAGRLVAEDGTDSVAAGYLAVAAAYEAAGRGDLARSLELIDSGVAAGRRLRCPDLVALALHQQGILLTQLGRTEEGLACLDESMVDLLGDRLSPMVTGIVYCGVIGCCWSSYELDRAQRWTAAMSDWCRAQPDLANFTGECRVRRAELKQLQGAWPDARSELDGVSQGDVDAWAGGMAAYLRGNLDRLQGRFESAEEAFAEAARLGCDPQPGLALLRLARGNVQAAAAMLRRCVAETHEDGKRVEVLAAATEVSLRVQEQEAAAAACTELAALAERCRTPIVRAVAAQARAAQLLAEGRPDAALQPARESLRHWLELPAPYHEARTRLLVAEACRSLGDEESALREVDTARELFTALGATPDLVGLPGATSLLSPRELEVLQQLATGATNRVIAARLVLSERTVDRHVSNIFGKLGVSSRAAATAYAFEHRLV